MVLSAETTASQETLSFTGLMSLAATGLITLVIVCRQHGNPQVAGASAGRHCVAAEGAQPTIVSGKLHVNAAFNQRRFIRYLTRDRAAERVG